MRSSEILDPLSQDDNLSGNKTIAWGRTNKPGGTNARQRFGYRQTWSASSAVEQPTTDVRTDSQNSTVGNRHSLLSGHAEDDAAFSGMHYESDGSSDNGPMAFWTALKTRVKQKGLPIVVDIEPGEAVWNCSIYAYRVLLNPLGNRGIGSIEVWFTDGSVGKKFSGPKAMYKKYAFEVQLDSNGYPVMGTDSWTGASIKDHPDFLWSPTKTTPENSDVQRPSVKKNLLSEQDEALEPGKSPELVPETGETPEFSPELAPEPGKTSELVPETGETPEFSPELVPPSPGSEFGSEILAISPSELIKLIADQTSDFKLDITVDKSDGGIYKVGEKIKASVKSEKGGFLYLIAISPKGSLTVLYPQCGDKNEIQDGQSLTVPGPDASYSFSTESLTGLYRIKAFVTDKPLTLAGWDQETSEPELTETGSYAMDISNFHWMPTTMDTVSNDVCQIWKNRTGKEGESVKKRFNLTRFAQGEVTFIINPPH